MKIHITGLKTMPEVHAGDQLGELIRQAAAREGQSLAQSTVVIVAQKIVSKAEGAIVDLRTIQPTPLARLWAERWGKDARLIELVLQQSRRIVRMDRGVVIVETMHGLVAANAGVDQSNTEGDDHATLLPADPDASARALRTELGCGAVIISDTFGRPWREGLVNVAIGVSGMEALEDLRGGCDRRGHVLSGTIIARADELAAAAGLVMPKSAGVPVALIEGCAWKPSEGSARTLIRSAELDLFR
jgi:coenzyme F420-0:L-glutamate ligase / coenzyme F420-1:gamma-L-glutamate ligase